MKSSLLLLLLILFSTHQSFAGFLRIVPMLQISQNDPTSGSLQLVGTVENEGDETAMSVRIESVRTNEILGDLGNFGSGEKKEISVAITEKSIGVNKDGYHNIPLRVLYKDGGQGSFSAAIVVAFLKKSTEESPAKSSPVTISFSEDIQKTGSLDLLRSAETTVSLLNTSLNPANVKLEFIGAKELEFKGDPDSVLLAPQEQKDIKVSIKNLSVIPGSSYASYVLVSGAIEGQAFSDYLGFVVNVKSSGDFSFTTIIAVILALVFAGVGFFYWKQETAAASMSKPKEPKEE